MLSLQAEMIFKHGWSDIRVFLSMNAPILLFDTATHTVWVQACTMTRMGDLLEVSSARAQQQHRHTDAEMSTKT